MLVYGVGLAVLAPAFMEGGGAFHGVALAAIALSFLLGWTLPRYWTVAVPAAVSIALFFVMVSMIDPYTWMDNGTGAFIFLLTFCGILGAVLCGATALGVFTKRASSRR